MVNVVIIEDDPMVVEVNAGFVRAVPDFQVTGTAFTAREGIQMIKKQKPHLTLLDIYLPDMDGVAALEEIRRLQLPTDVIMVTAARDSATIRNVLRYGAVDYIIKPFKFERLRSALQYYAVMQSRLGEDENVSQQELDSLTLARLPGEENQDGVPKGLSDITLKQVLLLLIKSGSAVSAYEVSDSLGMARVTARRYLEYLEKIGKVRLEVQYGGVGRPVNRYRAVQ